MKVSELEHNRELVPLEITKVQSDLRRSFIRNRCKTLLEDRSLAHPNKAGEILEGLSDNVVQQLFNEISSVIRACATIWQKMWEESLEYSEPEYNYKRHMLLGLVNPKLIRKYRNNGILADVLDLRRYLVTDIIWRAASLNPSLVTNPQKLDLLHRIVDRRLRTAERMLYSVGYPQEYGRTFDYPGPGGSTQVNQAANDYWTVEEEYKITLTDLGKGNVVEAINLLFEPQSDINAQNHLLCDPVIHALHLEAWVFTRKKWSSHEIDLAILAGAGCISITSSWVADLTRGRIPDEYEVEQPFMESLVDIDELQIGDQLRVFNHPAYDNSVAGGAIARLENVVVVRTGLNPSRYLLMGLGMKPQTVAEMRIELGKKFQEAISLMRLKVGIDVLMNPGIQNIPWIEYCSELVRLEPEFRPIPQDWNWPPYEDEDAKLADWWFKWRVAYIPHIGLHWSDLGFLRETQCVRKAYKSEEFKRALWDNHKIAYTASPDQDPLEDEWWGYGHFPLWMPRKKGGKFAITILGKVIAYMPKLVDLYFGGVTGGWQPHTEPNETTGTKVWIIKPIENEHD